MAKLDMSCPQGMMAHFGGMCRLNEEIAQQSHPADPKNAARFRAS